MAARRSDDGSRIERLRPAAGNGDNDGEYWKVTTTDGTQYFFGRNRLPGWTSADTETELGRGPCRSSATTPASPATPTTFADSCCQQAWRWNLDYVVDLARQHDDVLLRHRRPTRTAASTGDNGVSYDRGGYLKRIDYGQREGTETPRPRPAQVVFTSPSAACRRRRRLRAGDLKDATA